MHSHMFKTNHSTKLNYLYYLDHTFCASKTETEAIFLGVRPATAHPFFSPWPLQGLKVRELGLVN